MEDITSTSTTTTDTMNTSEGSAQGAASTSIEAAGTQTGDTNENVPQGESVPGVQQPKEPANAAETIIGEYTPNFKYKVKKKDLEFDDFFKSAIKNAEQEKKIRELHEKAFGLDEVKESRETYKKQLEEWQGKYNQVDESLKHVGNLVRKKDFRTFFEVLNIPKQDIINYAIEELKYAELPADQKAVIDQQRMQEREYESKLTENQMLQQQMSQLVQQQTAFELSQTLAKPDIAQVVQAYDGRMGPQAFMNEVIKRGQYYEAVHKVSPPASQLVEEIVNLIGGAQASAPQVGVAPSQVMQSQHSGSQAQQTKPVMTKFQGGSSKSPTKKVPQSLEDLRQMRQSAQI